MLKNLLYKLLKKSEKYTHTDMVYLAKSGSWLSLNQALSLLISFGLSIAYANLLDKETFGNYRYVLSAFGFISLLALPGVYTAITQSISRGFDGSLKTGFSKILRWGLLASAFALLLAIYYFIKDNNILGTSFVIIAIFLPIIESYGIYVSLLQGKKLFKQHSIFNLITVAISTLALLITIYLNQNIYIILLVYFLSIAIPKIIFYNYSQKKYIANDLQDSEVDHFIKRINAFQIFSNATQYIDKILLFTILGASQLAIFTFAIAIPEHIKGFFRISATVSFPKFATKSVEEIRKHILKKILLLGALISLAIVAYILLAPYIFKFLFPQYIEAVLLTQVIAITAIYSITYPIGAFLTAHKKVKPLFIISSSSFILGLIAMIIFIPIYDIWGAVIGLAINRLINIITSFYYLYKV